MRSRYLFVLALHVASVGCATDGSEVHGEPLLPLVYGTIEVAPTIDTAAWSTLEIQFRPEGEVEPGWEYRQSFEVSSTALPAMYNIGGDLGVNQYRVWRVTAWLTNVTPAAEAPLPDEPAASTTLVYECAQGCPSQSGIALVLE